MGAAHAATAIGSLLGKGVDITIPRIWFLELSQLKEFLSRLPKRCVCITTGFSGDGSGSLLLLFPASQIRNLKRILLSGFSPESNSYEPRDKSPDDDLILELGNIVMSHYLNAIADFLGGTIMLDPTALAIDMPDASVDQSLACLGDSVPDRLIVVENKLVIEGRLVRGIMLVIPREDILKKILAHADRIQE